MLVGQIDFVLLSLQMLSMLVFCCLGIGCQVMSQVKLCKLSQLSGTSAGLCCPAQDRNLATRCVQDWCPSPSHPSCWLVTRFTLAGAAGDVKVLQEPPFSGRCQMPSQDLL